MRQKQFEDSLALTETAYSGLKKNTRKDGVKN
jgi:hypothetical protein